MRTAAEAAELELNQVSLPKTKEAIAQRIAAWRKTAERYDTEPETREGRKELAARAKAAETVRDRSLAAYHHYEMASAALQIGDRARVRGHHYRHDGARLDRHRAGRGWRGVLRHRVFCAARGASVLSARAHLRATGMKTTFLEFEQPIAELEAKIDELRFVQDDSALDISEEIARLQKKSQALTREIYAKLSAWQISQVARHPQRPYALDYMQSIFTGFEELHGDRAFADDAAIVGGLARFNDQSVMVIGHQKGRDTKDKIYRNFGMPKPEGLPQGAAPDEARRKIRRAGIYLYRHARAPIRASAPRSAGSRRRSAAICT